MQKRLDDDRAAFQYFYNEIPKIWTTRSTRHAAKNLIELDRYRRLPLGWGKRDPLGWDKFQKLQSSEQRLRREFRFHLGELVKTAGPTGNLDTVWLNKALQLFDSIPTQERGLYRARREWGRRFIKDAKLVFDIGAANQIFDIARSGGQSVDSFRDYVCNKDLEKGHPPERKVYIGQIAAKAEHFGAGACSEQSAWVATDPSVVDHGGRCSSSISFHGQLPDMKAELLDLP
ncbi:hypothetical protein ACIQB5_51850, partial [Streptomyces sp. NPDC088560]|uniref:hypothetical protein n=1 Tax=Streptomyces sp. NPDC088560 TaxID=3365868 RepID=UPI003820775E